LPEPDGNHSDKIAQEAQPNDPSRLPVTVHLGQNVAEDVTHREDDDRGRQHEAEYIHQFYRCDVSRDQASDENRDRDHKPWRVSLLILYWIPFLHHRTCISSQATGLFKYY
jgi:hypothetical protein